MVTPFVVLGTGGLASARDGARVVLDDDAHHHLVRVLRRRDGDAVVATDGTGRRVEAVLDGDALAVVAVVDVPSPSPRIEVAQALGKGRKHDEVVRMLTELGVDVVTAVTTDRTQVDLSGKAERVQQRWRAVADAACSQARRTHRPQLRGPIPLDAWLAEVDPARTLVLVGDVDAAIGPLDALAGREDEAVAVVVGPEGGLTTPEVDAVVAAGGRRVSLGPTVLRTEHAGVVLAGIVAAATGRMG